MTDPDCNRHHPAVETMDARTLTALKASIKHWEDNADPNYPADRKSATGEDCALCVEFNLPVAVSMECLECPVYKMTGQRYCHHTPYYAAKSAMEEFGFVSLQFMEAAKAEADFLKSLLPLENAIEQKLV